MAGLFVRCKMRGTESTGGSDKRETVGLALMFLALGFSGSFGKAPERVFAPMAGQKLGEAAPRVTIEWAPSASVPAMSSSSVAPEAISPLVCLCYTAKGRQSRCLLQGLAGRSQRCHLLAR